jgi:mannose-1-phosphate guanylyltransferase
LKAMILAAGLGTRLRPLTLNRPKALMPVANRPMIDHVIDYLKRFGVEQIIVNAHHHHEQIVKHLDGGKPFGVPVEVRVELEILGTGGGIQNTAGFWEDAPFVVVNGDILTNIDLGAAYRNHLSQGNLVTLVLHDRAPFNQVLVDREMNVLDIAPAPHPGRLAFTGIHIISPALLDFLPKGRPSSIIDCYQRLIAEGRHAVRAYVSKGHDWRDIGTFESYREANREALGEQTILVGPGSRIDPSANLEEWVVIGKGCELAASVRVRRSVLWDKVIVREGIRIQDSVVTSDQEVRKHLIGQSY